MWVNSVCSRRLLPQCSDGVRDIYSAEGSAVDPDTPLVVLVNRGTASASEVRPGI